MRMPRAQRGDGVERARDQRAVALDVALVGNQEVRVERVDIGIGRGGAARGVPARLHPDVFQDQLDVLELGGAHRRARFGFADRHAGCFEHLTKCVDGREATEIEHRAGQSKIAVVTGTR